VSFLTEDETKRIQILNEVSKMLPGLDPERDPAYNSSLVLFRVNHLMSATDPYAEERKKYDKLAMEMIPELRGEIEASEDPLEMAIRVSVVGNVIDLGIKEKVDIEGTLELAKGSGFKIFEIEELRSELKNAKRVLYILDNAGEIVFDSLLIEQIRKLGKAVIAVVRGGPILNDAVMDDAKRVGLDKIAKVIDTGNNFVGVIRERCSPVFLKALDTAELVIAKGQGNYETLEGTRNDIFFILKAKCAAVAEHLGVKEGDLVLKRA